MTSKEFITNYNKAYPALKGYAVKLANDEADGLDVLQEASIKAYQYKNNVVSAKNFKGWMYKIIKNTYINRYTKVVRRRALLDKAPSYTFRNIQKTAENKGTSLLNMTMIMNRIQGVKDIYKKPFLMFYKGYSYEEIAKSLNVPIGTVKSRIYTAKKKMQKLLEFAIAA